jgi:hypothetical protein
MSRKNWKVSIVGENEIRLETEDGIVTQKRISENLPAPEEEVYNEFWTREIAAFLSDSEFLHSKWPRELQHLQWTLFHTTNYPSHKNVVKDLHRIMKKWVIACATDINCLAPPSRDMMEDVEFIKIFKHLNKQAGGKLVEV